MTDDVKDFRYYADAAERIISGITEDMPVLDVAAVAACAQVFATLAAGAPKRDQADDSEEDFRPGGFPMRDND